MPRFLLILLTSLTVTAAALGQDDDAAFNARQAKSLNSFAAKAFKKGFPRIAKVVWLQTIKLYDGDNEDAWTSLGYVKVGSSWNPDPDNEYPREDTGSGADGKPLRSAYDKLKKDLANKHRAQARKWQKADRRDMADKHWRLVLRWSKGDAEAEKELAHVAVGSLSGTDLEKTLYDRSKMIEAAVAAQSKIEYEVERVEDAECKPLQVAEIPYVTVRSEHFTLHGDPENEEALYEALRWAERTLQVCKVAFPWEVRVEGQWPREWACLQSKDMYHQVLKANKVPELEWKLENGASDVIGRTEVTNTKDNKILVDSCTRNVAQGYSGLRSTGYREGIGHTFVGMMFNNNRLFAIDRKRQEGTTASEEDREFQSPDFDIWKNLNLEMAWRTTGGVPANELPFCDASNFSNEERIKAWSFVDYMMRRDPEMLRTMDQIARDLKKKRSKQSAVFEEQFAKAHPGVSIGQLDQEWEDFWTGASPVLKAIQHNTPPLEAISKDIDKWLKAFNAARARFEATPAKWSANLSTRCKDHVEYLLANKDLRGPGPEHTQSIELGGSYVGGMFAQMAVVVTGATASKAKKTFEDWDKLPGYRDALLNQSLRTIGMFADKDVMVMNAVSGLAPPIKSKEGVTCYPPKANQGVTFDGEVSVELLGPDMEKWLAKHGREGQKSVGYPLTLHFGGLSAMPVSRKSITCVLKDRNGTQLDGFFSWDDGRVRRTSAPGVVVFWPFEPLKGEISFQWSWGDGGRNQSVKGTFTTK